MGRIRLIAVILLIAGLAIGFFVYDSEIKEESRFPFRLGLDLSGGTLLTYRADVTKVDSSDLDDSLNALRDVIERRVNLFGVSEPLVQIERAGGEERLIVELPGITDPAEADRLIGETPLLEFQLLTGDPNILFNNLSTTSTSTLNLNLGEAYTPTGLTGRFLKRASLQFGQGGPYGGGISNTPTVVLEFDGEGSDLFAEITRENVGEILAVFLDGRPITQPVIQSEIPNGTAVITGDFNPEEARELVKNLNFGALPVPIELISTQTVGATLGSEILDGGVRAGVWGLILVAIFLILWYRLPGLLAVVSLGIYVVIMLAIFKLVPVTLTAAGIAGFILSIGMAVDANILIFERLKEELREGRPMKDAVKEGFKRAWLSIRDSNLSTLITAVILFWFGTSIVEGFALTLGVGILVSMITAISITRTFLFAVAAKKKSWLFGTGIK